MPVVRLDTYKASAFLVSMLHHSGATVLEDGGDIIEVRLISGERVSIHLIETSIPAYEIKSTVAYNEANNAHTLFLIWADMLLPPEGHVVEVEEWEQPLLALYGGCIWAYDVFGGEIFVYPIHYDRVGQYHEIRYGSIINVRHMVGTVVDVSWPGMRGQWRVAGFADRTHFHHQHQAHAGQAGKVIPPDSLAACWLLLGLDADDSEPEDVKTAFRRLARQIHPDVNKAVNATAQMQALNDAYRRVMAAFDDDEL
jgi:hypothetical protein